MPKIPVLAPPYKNVDEAAALQGGSELIDGYFDETGALNKRWGLWPWWSLTVIIPENPPAIVETELPDITLD